MTCEVEIRGRRRTIEVRRAGQDWTATLDGRTMPMSVTDIGGRRSLLIGLRSYEVSLESPAMGKRIVHVNGVAVPVSILDPRMRFTRGPGAIARAGAGPRRLVAPMPGRIVKVLVAVGDVVTARQGLVVVEAMKMENELRAPGAGTVTDVRVTAGMSVDANAVLIVME